jgi:hypothetical protein
MTPPMGWNDQDIVPVYEWLNEDDNNSNVVHYAIQSGASAVVVENTHYFSYVEGVGDGTAGVGVGVIASRPATCTTGVLYWATDEGSWRTEVPITGYTGQGRAYKCTATNTWSLYYTPYTYPFEPGEVGGGGTRGRRAGQNRRLR